MKEFAMGSTWSRLLLRLPFATLLIAVVLAATACSSGDSSQSGTPSGDTEISQTDPGAARVAVRETEFSIGVPVTELQPGVYKFAVENAGVVKHDLVIDGPGVESARTDRIAGGATAELTVNLRPGKYELWCSVGNHRDAGMSATITVR
ncbi:hypothetical protein [Nocardia ninae]|uniref:hypothetical protein n=1 Tax=Nocardia ninae TaxID=356145 RepID=UPI0011BD9F50|nr:hypothetical protein [Nocardia ninae]